MNLAGMITFSVADREVRLNDLILCYRDKLEGRDREIWQRYVVDEETQASIAARLGVSKPRVSQLCMRLRRAFRRYVLDSGHGDLFGMTR